MSPLSVLRIKLTKIQSSFIGVVGQSAGAINQMGEHVNVKAWEMLQLSVESPECGTATLNRLVSIQRGPKKCMPTVCFHFSFTIFPFHKASVAFM
jgi:hypothetical protein